MDAVFHRPQKLMVYRERSASVAKLMPALAKAELEFAPIVRDAVGHAVRRDANGRPKEEEFRYASLDSLHRSTKAALLRQGIVPTQEFCVSNEGITLVTALNYGDEFISSTLPVRQFENQDQLLGHMKRMRRVAYASILCIDAELDAEVEDAAPQESAVIEPSQNGKAPPDLSKLWVTQEQMALDAIGDAKTPAKVEDILAKVRKKIATSDMDPHCLGRMEEAGSARVKELKDAPRAVSNGKPVAQEAAK